MRPNKIQIQYNLAINKDHTYFHNFIFFYPAQYIDLEKIIDIKINPDYIIEIDHKYINQ